MRVVAGDAAGIRTQPRHQAGAGRIADSLLAVGTLKTNPGFGQCIDMWTDNVIGSVAPQFRPQVIHGDEQDVGP